MSNIASQLESAQMPLCSVGGFMQDEPGELGETTSQSLRFPSQPWLEFGGLCTSLGLRRREVLYDLVWGWVKEHGSAEQVAVFEQGAADMAARRSRKPRVPRRAAGGSHAPG
jgi:hypothetical protein